MNSKQTTCIALLPPSDAFSNTDAHARVPGRVHLEADSTLPSCPVGYWTVRPYPTACDLMEPATAVGRLTHTCRPAPRLAREAECAEEQGSTAPEYSPNPDRSMTLTSPGASTWMPSRRIPSLRGGKVPWNPNESQSSSWFVFW